MPVDRSGPTVLGTAPQPACEQITGPLKIYLEPPRLHCLLQTRHHAARFREPRRHGLSSTRGIAPFKRFRDLGLSVESKLYRL